MTATKTLSNISFQTTNKGTIPQFILHPVKWKHSLLQQVQFLEQHDYFVYKNVRYTERLQ